MSQVAPEPITADEAEDDEVAKTETATVTVDQSSANTEGAFFLVRSWVSYAHILTFSL